MNYTLYATMSACRDMAWDNRERFAPGYVPTEPLEDPPTQEAMWWYQQGQAEAYAHVMSLLEREA